MEMLEPPEFSLVELRMKPLKASILVFLIAFTFSSSVFAQATGYVKKKTTEVTKLLSKKDSKARAKKLDKLLSATINFRELASRSLGEHWTARTEEERTEFLNLLQQLLRTNYETKLSGKKLGKDFKVEYISEKNKGDIAIVKTKVIVDAESKPIMYRLMKKEKTWSIYDVVIDDISLEETYRESYTEIIVEEGWKSLISRMKARIK